MSWTLQDLIDVPNLQMLLHRFHAATGIPVGVLDSDGKVIVANGWQEICTSFHRIHPVTAERCGQSDQYIKTRLCVEGYAEYKCRNGLWDLAVPIVITGEHVGTLFLGQLFYQDEEIDEKFFRDQAREFGFDEGLYMGALRRIPVLTRLKVRQIMDFFTSFVNFLVGIGLARFQRAEAERTLRESEEKYAKAFRSTPSVLVICTMAEGRYVEVNDTFEQVLGYGREEVVGRTFREFDIWESPEERKRLDQAIAEKGKVRGVEARFRKTSGDVIIGLLSAEVIEIGGEKSLLVLFNDITDRKRLEKEIEILNTELASHAFELETANRELEAFNYSVSHDLCAPVTVVTGYCDLLMEMAELGEQPKRYIREIRVASKQMERLIGTLLEFSRMSRCAMSREEVDLALIARRVALQMEMADPERRVSFALAAELKARGDARLLEVVLTNLLGNAWKYTGKRETAHIEFGSAEMEGGTVYFVRDNGEGFDMAHADKLFRPFERLPGTGDISGHGVGLASVQRIIQRHGGRVWAEGEPGRGATFFFTL